jgi:hypothetical protein
MTRRIIDWEAIEKDWRAGIKSKKQISTEFGVSRAAMDKHFAKSGITRDLKAKIQAKAAALVTQSMVSSEVTPKAAATEIEIVEVNAQAIAWKQLSHRQDIKRGRVIMNKLFDELEAMCDHNEELQQLANIIAEGEQASEKQIEMFRKVIGYISRVGSVKQLVETMKNLIALEREAFGMNPDGRTNTTKTLEDVLAELDRSEE